MKIFRARSLMVVTIFGLIWYDSKSNKNNNADFTTTITTGIITPTTSTTKSTTTTTKSTTTKITTTQSSSTKSTTTRSTTTRSTTTRSTTTESTTTKSTTTKSTTTKSTTTQSTTRTTKDIFDTRTKDVCKRSHFKKIDWHDYTQMLLDTKSIGIGEQGKPASLPKNEEEYSKKLFEKYGFNAALSDKIAVNRSLPDGRHPNCKNILYMESLPTVSVVIPFHNEYLSTLLRTVHSVVNRSPKHLIKEIFLVDDASTTDFSKETLHNIIKENIPKAKVIHLKERTGLVGARLAGAKRASADVLLFLDSHIEVNVNWLPPLLEPIAKDYHVVMCPIIDVIKYDTFEYIPETKFYRNGFDWRFFNQPFPILPKDKQNMPMAFKSPVMTGGIFAISRRFFWKLGGYDPELHIWGAEQFELSFKNSRRVVDVWMDEYAKYVYARSPQYLDADPGDLKKQMALRQKLHCKPFKWFMNQVAFDLEAVYPVIEPRPFAEGHIRPRFDQDMCLDASGQPGQTVLITHCRTNDNNQTFSLTWFKGIRVKSRNLCWDVPESRKRGPVVLQTCHEMGGNQMWEYHKDTELLVHDSGTCLDHDSITKKVFVGPCNGAVFTQLWTFDKINLERMNKWNEEPKRVTGPIDELSNKIFQGELILGYF